MAAVSFGVVKLSLILQSALRFPSPHDPQNSPLFHTLQALWQPRAPSSCTQASTGTQ